MRYANSNWCLYNTVLQLMGKHKKNLESEALFLLWKKEIQEMKSGLIMSYKILLLNGQTYGRAPGRDVRAPWGTFCVRGPRQGRNTPAGLSSARPWWEQHGHTASSRLQQDRGKRRGCLSPRGGCTQLWGCLDAALCVRSFWRLESSSEICMPKHQYSGSSVVLYLSWMYSLLIKS